MMRFIAPLTVFFLVLSFSLVAQNPVKWTFSSKKVSDGVYDLIVMGTIEEGWCTYSQFLESDEGPVPTSFTFEKGGHYVLEGKTQESGEKIVAYDKIFAMNLTKYKHKVIFTQRVKVTDPKQPIKGQVSFMSCNDEMCLPPKDVDFSIQPK